MLTILTENDAFLPRPEVEISRLLLDCAARMRDGELTGKLRDGNGNVVGDFGTRDKHIDLPFNIKPAERKR